MNVNDDIRNLQKLKAEIENVKKALKGIDVKVDINIKEGLEAQLRSLTEQYDALADKISETEGRIRISTERINDTTKKIVEAQSKLIASAQQGSQQPALQTGDTPSIQAQAKAYDDLKNEIDAVLGSRSENIKRMVEEQNAIRLINAELKKMEKSSMGGHYSPAQIKRIEQLNSSLMTHKAALAEVRQVLSNNVKIDNAAADSMTRLSQELNRMKMAYRELTQEEQKSPFGEELLASINQLDAKMKELDASIGNHQRNIGNYGNSFNGLNVSVQQIVRELPSAAMGLNTFFLAISNNIPMLVDEINRARKANEGLAQSARTPVWKQLASSLFSWQTALMVGISLLSVYGKDLANWVSGLFNGEKGLKTLEDALNDVNDALKENMGGYGDSVTKLKTLQNNWNDLGEDINSKSKLLKENASFFNELGIKIKSVSDAENLFTKNTPAVIKALALKARAAAAYQLAVEEEKKAFQKTTEAEKAMLNTSIWDYWNAGIDAISQFDATIQGIDTFNPEKYTKARAGALLIESDAAAQAAESYRKLFQELQKQANDILVEAGFSLDINGEPVENLKDMSDTLLSIQRQNEQEEINLMKDSEEKRLKQIELNYKMELDKIRKWEKQLMEARGGNLSDEESSAISSAYTLAEDKRDFEINQNQYTKLLEQYRGYFEQRKAIEEKYNKDREGLIAAGASQESLNENEYQKNEALNAIDMEFATREEEFQIWADKVVGLSLEELTKLVTEAEEKIAEMESKNPNDENLSKARAGLQVIKSGITEKRKDEKEEEPSPNASKKWKELYDTLRDVEDQFGEIGDAVGGTVGDIIDAAGSIASSTLTMINGIQTLTKAAGESMDETTKAAGESMKTVEKASVILSIIGAALQIATKIASLFGPDYSDYNKAKENYEAYSDVLEDIIDKQKELAETMTGKDAVKASEEALELIEKQAKAAREMGKMRLESGGGLFSHTVGVRQRKNMSEEGWSEALDSLGVSAYNKIREGRMYGLFDLSVEQLDKLKMEAPLFWSQLDKDVREYLEQIITTDEAIESMKETLQESLTGMSFDDVSSDVLESLYDIEKGAEEIFDDMSDYMRKSMIKAMYVKNYEPQMKQWYEQWSKAMEDGIMSTQERTSLDSLKESIIKGATEAAENINSMFDFTSEYTQEATGKGFETMTQDQAGELNGRFTALQNAGEVIKNEVTLTRINTDKIALLQANANDLFSGFQEQVAESNLHLYDISNNTGESLKCLKVIQSDIAQVKENTSNL